MQARRSKVKVDVIHFRSGGRWLDSDSSHREQVDRVHLA